MPSYWRQFFNGTLVVQPDSWHAQVYQYWRARGHLKTSGYRENLCHYVRVLVIWAPLMWFFRGQETQKIKPWVYAAVPTTLAAVALSFYRWTLGALDVLMWMGIFTGVIIVVLGLMFLFDEFPERMQKTFKYLSFPIWGPCVGVLFVIVVCCELLDKYLITPYGPGVKRWFFGAHILWVVYPWSVVAATVVSLSFYFEPGRSLWGLVWIGCALAIVSLLIGSSIYADYCKHKAAARAIIESARPTGLSTSGPVKRPPRAKPIWILRLLYGIASGAQVAWHFASAKEKKICPFIVLAGMEEEPEPVLAD
jgi:hypothetical protein